MNGAELVQLVDSTPIREHIDALVDAGMTHHAIGRAAGISRDAVARIARGHRQACRRGTAAAILAVAAPADLDPRPDLDHVDRLGTVRRLQALATLGWTLEDIAVRAGHDVEHVQAQASRWIADDLAAAVATVYDDLSMRLGPSVRLRSWARGRGYTPPLGWDDIDVDECPAPVRSAGPDLFIDEVAVARRMAGDQSVRLTKREREVVVARWLESGRGWTELRDVTGIRGDRIAARLGATA